MKKKLALVLAVVMLLCSALCACGEAVPAAPTKIPAAPSEEPPAPVEASPAPTEEPAAEGKQLTVIIGSDPETLDPALNVLQEDGNKIIHLLECLLIADENGELTGGCAETWETSEDGLTWTFRLRGGLKWSDGSPLTAEDFVYSWKRVADPATESPYAEIVLQPIKGYEEALAGNPDALCISAPDEQTFVVELSAPCTYFGSLAAFATLSPVQRATVEANGGDWALSPETYIGNGAFRISEWVPGSYIVMEKNPNYRDADAIKLDSIKWLFCDSDQAAYDAYGAGEVLLTRQVASDALPELMGREDFRMEPIIGTYFVTLNTSVEPFTDPSVRRALSLAVDRQYVTEGPMLGSGSPARNFIGPGWLDPAGGDFMANANGGDPYISEDMEANLAEARALMRQAGYHADPANPDLHLTYSTNDANQNVALAEYLREAWAKIGVELEINIVDSANFSAERRAGNFEISRNGWIGDYSDPSSLLDLMYSTNGNNDGRYTSAAFDAAIDTARSTADPVVRSQALHEAEDIMMTDMACIPIEYYNTYWLQSPLVEGMWHTSTGYLCFMYADIAA